MLLLLVGWLAGLLVVWLPLLPPLAGWLWVVVMLQLLLELPRLPLVLLVIGTMPPLRSVPVAAAVVCCGCIHGWPCCCC